MIKTPDLLDVPLDPDAAEVLGNFPRYELDPARLEALRSGLAERVAAGDSVALDLPPPSGSAGGGAVTILGGVLTVGVLIAVALTVGGGPAPDGEFASGRVTLRDGRIGISGSVLFSLNSAELQDEGRALLRSLIPPLKLYVQENDQLLMVIGFTDDLPIQQGNLQFSDNWELSAQRALTVTRALIDEGMPADRVFAAAFGDQQPVAANTDEDSRARNRRVEFLVMP